MGVKYAIARGRGSRANKTQRLEVGEKRCLNPLITGLGEFVNSLKGGPFQLHAAGGPSIGGRGEVRARSNSFTKAREEADDVGGARTIDIQTKTR